MKTLTAAAAAISIALAAAPALAGVVITQQQTMTSQNGERKLDQTVMVQGNKQKVVTGNNQVILDLDKGTMYVVDVPQKNYLEIPFPPRGAIAAAMLRNTGLSFKKVGKSQKVAGYSCEEYTGSGKTMFGEYHVTECVARSAPGAKEFYAFQKLMASRLKSSGAAPSGDIPDGIPMSSETVTKMNAINFSGMSPEQEKRIQQAMANRKPTTTSTVVTKIEEKKLADSDFAVPAGFSKREMQMRMGMPMHAPHPMPSAPPAK
jgi:Domain of unknown function (DUF4412)